MEEAKIPVFSVLKKGTTLKNIFLNSPPQEFRKSSSQSTEHDPILIGRHPDCHIIVDHPSISRFHLEVRPKKTLQKIFITDRSSVHGTWVSGRKILPNIPIELIEGDTVRLGASSRIYRLHWMPLSHAFEMEKPMSPLLEEEVLQDENLNVACFSYVLPSAPPFPEIMNAPSPGKPSSRDSKRAGQSLIRKVMEEESSCFSSVAPLLESISFSLPVEKREASKNLFANEMTLKREERSALSPLTSDKRDQSSSLLSRRNKSIIFLQIEKTSEETMGEMNSVQREVEIEEEQGIVAFERGYGEEKFLPVLLAHGADEAEEEESFASESSKREDRSAPSPLTSDKRDKPSCLLSRRNKSIRFLQIEKTSNAATGENRSSVQGEVEIEEQRIVASERGYGEEKLLAVLLPNGADVGDEDEESFVSDKENMTPLNSITSKALKSNKEIGRSPPSALGLFNLEEGPSNSDNENATPGEKMFVKTDEPKSGSQFMKEKDESKVSDANDLGQHSSSFMLQRSLFKQERSTLVGNKILNAQEFSNSHNHIESSKSSKHLKSNNHKSINCWTKENEESKGSDANNLKLCTSEVKLQRSLFKPERLSMDENKAMNMEEDIFHPDKENWTPEVPKSFKADKTLARDLLKVENQEDEAFVSDKEESKGNCANDLEQLFSSHTQEDKAFRSDKEGSKGNRANDLEQLFSSEVKLQRSLFRPERSPVCENIVLNVEENSFFSDKENWTPEVPKALRSGKASTGDLLKDDAFVSDKENLTPQTSRSTKSKKLLTESHSKFEEETMKKRKERIPFQPLFESSPLRKSSSGCHVQVRDENGSICANNAHNSEEKTSDNQHMDELPYMGVREKKKWYLIVDVGCFLNEESRKSLLLLEGIRGTQLIIPRIVIRELDHLKRSEGLLFSRGTKASSVLQWIEKCMVNTSWWIHIQSSSETLPVVPTPPSTPRSQLCDGATELCTTSSNFTGFSTCGSLMEIVSPTAEDHIIDCALLFKKIKDDGQLMLLSSSTTLRIKAMAEGLWCETPKEFRDSLVNPFSKRFLWTDSSPRGSTWSCSEVGPSSENCFQQFPALRTTKAAGTVKGLKLILLHNSHYGTINSVY